MVGYCQVLKVQNNWQTVNTNLSRYRFQSPYVLLNNAQGDTSQDSRIYKLQKEEFRNCLVRLIKKQAQPVETRVHRILSQPKHSSSLLRIRVSNPLLLVYKGNPKHVFVRLFRERKVCLFLYLGFCTQKSLSYLLLVLFLEETYDPVLQKLLPSLVIKGVDDLNLQGWSWSHKQESLC